MTLKNSALIGGHAAHTKKTREELLENNLSNGVTMDHQPWSAKKHQGHTTGPGTGQ